MPSVTIPAAGSVVPTLTSGTNTEVARRTAAIISSAVGSVTVNSGGTAPAPPADHSLLVVNTNNPLNLNYPSSYQYVVVGDSPAPITVSGGGAPNEQIVLGAGAVAVNTGGGSGTIVGGDGDKAIDVGASYGFAVYTGGGHDTIDLRQSVATGRNTVEAGAGANVFSNGVISQPGNTVLLGAGATQVRSTGPDSITAGAGATTIQVVGNVQDTVRGGAGAMTVVNASGQIVGQFFDPDQRPALERQHDRAGRRRRRQLPRRIERQQPAHRQHRRRDAARRRQRRRFDRHGQ